MLIINDWDVCPVEDENTHLICGAYFDRYDDSAHCANGHPRRDGLWAFITHLNSKFDQISVVTKRPDLKALVVIKQQLIPLPKDSFSFKRTLTDRTYFIRVAKVVAHYALIGLSGVAVNLVTFNALLYLGHMNPSVANIIAVVFSMTSNVVIALRSKLVKP